MLDKDAHRVRLMGQRILSEANDLKRTLGTLAKEINRPESLLKDLLSGNGSVEEALSVAKDMAKIYPIDLSSLIVDPDENVHRVKVMRDKESQTTGRVFDRIDRRGERTPYYEYRDCALTKLSPFRPEWIKELRVVKDTDPENPDVAYNNGHLMHQMTAFIGPVNFYWEVNGKKYVRQMETGDSNFITPFWKHSFTSRDEKKEAIIIAVTFSGDVGRARNELYSVGSEKINAYSLNLRDQRIGISQLIKQAMGNKNLSISALKSRILKSGVQINLDSVLDPGSEKTKDQLMILSEIIGVPFDHLYVPEYDVKEEVVVREKAGTESYVYTDSDDPDYEIRPLAGSIRMAMANGFDITVISSDRLSSEYFESSLHDFIYNYGESPVFLEWEESPGNNLCDVVKPADSVSIQPFVKYKFWNKATLQGKLFIFRVPGAINVSVQKELSSFASQQRVIESTSWFS